MKWVLQVETRYQYGIWLPQRSFMLKYTTYACGYSYLLGLLVIYFILEFCIGLVPPSWICMGSPAVVGMSFVESGDARF
jgi:hypothetical protein